MEAEAAGARDEAERLTRKRLAIAATLCLAAPTGAFAEQGDWLLRAGASSVQSAWDGSTCIPVASPLGRPKRALPVGYAIVEDLETGKVLVDADDATVGSDIRARLANGELTATIKSKTS